MNVTGSKDRGFDLLIQYLNEKEESLVIYNDDAMFIYKIEGTNIHISNAITDKNKRRSGKAKELLDHLKTVVAKANQCKTITCNVDLNQRNPDLSMKSVLGTGFKIIPTNSPAWDLRMASNIVQFYMEIK